MTLEELNALEEPKAVEALMKCCGSARWAMAVARRRPFSSLEALRQEADAAWRRCGEADWLEAFSHHPRIGGKDALRAKFAATRSWSEGEQASVSKASEAVLEALAAGNDAYEKKFGRVFLVCATGKSAEEMLSLLEARLPNDARVELEIAAGEQAKITRIRLDKLLGA